MSDIKKDVNIIISMEATCDLSNEIIKENDFRVVDMHFLIDGNDFCTDSDDVVSTDVRELLSTLSPKYRAAMEAVFVERLTVKEAAAVLMTSEASLRKRIERARRQLVNLREKERNK